MSYLITTTLIWAFSFGLIGNTLSSLDPLQVASTRLLLALITFSFFIKPAQISRSDKWQLMFIGAIQYGLMYSCYLSAFNFLPSHLVALFSVFTPFYVVAISNLRNKHFTPWYLVAAGLSILGAAIIKIESTTSGIYLDGALQGFCLMQVASIAFAYGQVHYRDWKKQRPEVKDSAVFAFLYLGAALVTITSTLVIYNLPPIPTAANTTQWLTLLYLGLIASGLGFFFWNKGATQTNIGSLAACNNAIVPLAVFISLFIFGEADKISSQALVALTAGTIFIVVALLLGVKKSSKYSCSN